MIPVSGRALTDRERTLRRIGVAVAAVSVVAPALPLGPLFAQPPWPYATLWLAYGRAIEEEGVSIKTMLLLIGLGLVHDHLAGGPYGLFAALYLLGFEFSRFGAQAMNAPNLVSAMGAFAAACAGVIAVAWGLTLGPFGLGDTIWPFIQTVVVTVALFPLAAPLYLRLARPPRTPRLKRRR
jgi:cell shape-determining protein MreD